MQVYELITTVNGIDTSTIVTTGNIELAPNQVLINITPYLL